MSSKSKSKKSKDDDDEALFSKPSRRGSESDSQSEKKKSKDKKRSSSEERSRSSSRDEEISKEKSGKSKEGKSSKSSSKEGKSSSKEGKSSKDKKKSKGSSSSKPGNLIYAMVAKKSEILAEFTSYKGNFSSVAQQALDQLDADETQVSIPHGNYMLYFLLDRNFTFMVLADENYQKKIAFAFLERVKEDFLPRYGKKGMKAKAGELQKDYGPKLQGHLQYVLDNPEEMDKFAKIKSQVADVKGIMQGNIQKAMARGEKLESLQNKTDELKDQAGLFKKQGEQIKNKMWFENMKVKIIIFGGFAILAFILFAQLKSAI